MKEEWREIQGYDGLYFVSSFGNIKKISYKDRDKHNVPERIIKQRKDKDGYCIVTLFDKNGKRKDCKVHRLVASAYIPNPNDLPMVNHINEIKDCNYSDNLEWCDAKYNSNYGTRPLKISIFQKGKPKPYMQGKNNYFYGKRFYGDKSLHARRVIQYSLDGDYIKSYSCIVDAANEVGVTGGAISMCCKGKRKRIAGYVWRYED